MNRLALIDGDILSYELGFASQSTIYLCNGRAYESKEDARNVNGPDAVLVPEVIPQHKRAALKMVRERINGIIEAVDAGSVECYLTGKGNFREDVATIARYKGNRENFVRPFHYQNIRDYLESKYDAKVIHGMEADDMLAIRQFDNLHEAVICSRDKDLRQVEGYHYSWGVGKQVERPLYYITREEGRYNLAHQMLTGDTTDNILGCIGIGDKKADKILEGLTTKVDIIRAVYDTYHKVYGWMANEDGRIYYQHWNGSRMWKTVEEILEENSLLLSMRTEL